MALTYRSVKGSALTHDELDNNFRHFTGSHSITGSLTVSGSSIYGIGQTQLTGSLIISSSDVTKLTIKGAKNDNTGRDLLFTSSSLILANAGYTVTNTPPTFLITGSEAVHQYITSNESATLHLTTHVDNYKTQIAFHDSASKMFMLGANNNALNANDHFLISTGSDLDSNSVFKIQRSTGKTGIGTGWTNEGTVPTAELHISGGASRENLFTIADDIGREYFKVLSGSTADRNLIISGTVDMNSLPTADPLITGSLWVSGSQNNDAGIPAGYVMISGIHG
jgi:hypothetical protein